MAELDELLLHVDPPVVVLHVVEGQPAWTLQRLKQIALEWPGGYRLAFCIGRHTVALGERWNVLPTAQLRLMLGEFGRVEVLEDPASDLHVDGGTGPAEDDHAHRPDREA